jgi:hypothetical protein
MSDIQVVTKSRLACFGSCQRLHHLRYNLGVRPLVDGDVQAWGNLMHAGLEAWWRTYQGLADGEEPLTGLPLGNAQIAMFAYREKSPSIDDAAMAKAAIMMAAYDARWAPTMHEWEVLGVEVEFIAMIPGRRRLRVAGKLDALVRKRSHGSVWFVEHKTTGADLSAGATYWQRLRMDPQVSIYFGGCQALGHDPAGCIYDVIDRPNEKPLKATPEDKRKYTKPTKKDPVSRLYANQREADETLEEFQSRIAAAVTEQPDLYFARAEVVRLESELEESAKDVEAIAIQIRDSATAEHAPRNPGACHMYGRTCEMFDVCSGTASIDDETRFRRAENPHEELTLTA